MPYPTQVVDEDGALAAQQALRTSGAELWPPLKGWRVQRVASGVRALPSTSVPGAIGAVPIAGKLPGGHGRW